MKKTLFINKSNGLPLLTQRWFASQFHFLFRLMEVSADTRLLNYHQVRTDWRVDGNRRESAFNVQLKVQRGSDVVDSMVKGSSSHGASEMHQAGWMHYLVQPSRFFMEGKETDT